jgi:hypothetical protein
MYFRLLLTFLEATFDKWNLEISIRNVDKIAQLPCALDTDCMASHMDTHAFQRNSGCTIAQKR